MEKKIVASPRVKTKSGGSLLKDQIVLDITNNRLQENVLRQVNLSIENCWYSMCQKVEGIHSQLKWTSSRQNIWEQRKTYTNNVAMVV